MSDSNGTIKVPPGVWTEASTPVQTGSGESSGVTSAVVLTTNGLIDALGTLSFVSGATNLARAMATFGDNIERSLGCVAVDLAVVASGLQVAAKVFAATDSSLAATFQSLETQMSYYTTMTAVKIATPATFTPLHDYVPHTTGGGGGGFSLGHLWHNITNWAGDAGSWVSSSLSHLGAPSEISQAFGELVVGVVVIGGVVVVVGAAA